MTDASSIPPFPPSDPPAGSDVAGTLRGAADRVSTAIAAGQKPGMPLSVLSNIAREAPLGSLFVAFLLGMAFARRR
jgi:hypothetical protein